MNAMLRRTGLALATVLALAARVMTGESPPGAPATPLAELWRLAPMVSLFAGAGLIGYLTAALLDRHRVAPAKRGAQPPLH